MEVWTDWYQERAEGHASSEVLEFARVALSEETWVQGPKGVNAEIRRLTLEHAAMNRGETTPQPNDDTSENEIAAALGQRPAAYSFSFQSGRNKYTHNKKPLPSTILRRQFIRRFFSKQPSL